MCEAGSPPGTPTDEGVPAPVAATSRRGAGVEDRANTDEGAPESSTGVDSGVRCAPSTGVGPWPGGRGEWPDDPRFDPELLENGDHRNVEDRYRYWTMDAIRADVASRTLGFEVAVENLDHDFNIGSIVRTANALGARRVHVVGRRRWNRRGAMVTDRYMEVGHRDDAGGLARDCAGRGVTLVGVDNVEGSVPIGTADLPEPACLVFGSEARGLSPEMVDACALVVHIPQRGSTRSMNVGHAAAIAMWEWVRTRPGEPG